VREARESAELDRRSHVENARNEHASVTDAARAEAEAEVERSRGEIGRSLGEARSALRESTEPLAREAAARILGRSLS
jgi:F0F1-type ATP synthase membrane subunit b/b'